MTEIIAQFSGDFSHALKNNQPSAPASEVLSAVHSAGASIEPLHSGSNDPALLRYFVIRVSDDGKAEELASRLRTLKSTEAAYIKPPGEAP